MAYGTFATVIVCLAFCVKNWNLQFPCMAVLLQRPLQKSIELFYFLRNEGNPPVWKSGTLSLPWTLGTSSWIFLQPSTLFLIFLSCISSHLGLTATLLILQQNLSFCAWTSSLHHLYAPPWWHHLLPFFAELYLSTKVFTQLLLQSLQPLLKLNDPNLEDQRSTRWLRGLLHLILPWRWYSGGCCKLWIGSNTAGKISIEHVTNF